MSSLDVKITVLPFIIVVFSLNRIIAMCGDYYIGGRRFSSLSDLIGYYSYVSCLLKGEKLLSPVAPPEVRLTPWLEVCGRFQNKVNFKVKFCIIPLQIPHYSELFHCLSDMILGYSCFCPDKHGEIHHV